MPPVAPVHPSPPATGGGRSNWATCRSSMPRLRKRSKAVRPAPSACDGSARARTSRATRCSSPRSHAACSGAEPPSQHSGHTAAPCVSSASAAWRRPVRTASRSGEPTVSFTSPTPFARRARTISSLPEVAAASSTETPSESLAQTSALCCSISPATRSCPRRQASQSAVRPSASPAASTHARADRSSSARSRKPLSAAAARGARGP
mmetsp:Transcript_52296/g.144868  ORF Transcript_52296/g.144868 Transcript_52296/m.144868 type:complete len:207 (+) Transcript_52296:132-752(+)